jgi:hypothetical protein
MRLNSVMIGALLLAGAMLPVLGWADSFLSYEVDEQCDATLRRQPPPERLALTDNRLPALGTFTVAIDSGLPDQE